MNQLKPHRYYPHALLLIGVSVCITLVLSGPTQTPHQSLSDSQAAASARSHQFFNDSDYSRTYTNSLADLLREARRKVVRMRMLNKSDQAEQTPEQERASLNQATPQRRMVRRFDQRNMLDVNPFTPVVYEEYAVASNPLAWHRPDALPPREYTVLGFGEVGNEQLTDTQTLDEPLPATPATTTASIAESDTDALSPVVSPAVAPIVSFSPSPLAEVAVPVQASQASRSVPVQSAPDQPDSAQPVAARPASAQPTTQALAAAPAKTTPAQITQSPVRATPQATVSLSRDSAKVATTNKAPVVQPTASPRPVAVAAKTPAPSDDDTDTDSAPGRSGFTPSANSPTVSLPTKAVITQAQDKHVATPTTPSTPGVAKSKAVPSTPVQVSPPATVAKIAPPQNNPTDPLVVYVEDHEEVGSDKLDAIRNAISRINKDTDIPVRLELTTDSSRAHDIRFREDAGKDMGNKLGVTTLAYTEDNFGNQTYLRPGTYPAIEVPEITLNSAFNWFAGEDANDIDDDEFDYETTFLHESLHVLGLDDDFDNQNAASHGTLAPGVTRRDLDKHDRDELAELYETFNPWSDAFDGDDDFDDDDFNPNRYRNIRRKSQALTALVPEPVSALVVGMGVLVGMMRRRR